MRENLALLFIGAAIAAGAGYLFGAVSGSVATPVAIIACVGAVVMTAPDRTL